jgi:5-methyltetrahydropteroyltriglutamate--homocysteine methyltransferase
LTTRLTPPFRADHVGSLLRPRNLHDARADHAAGRITDAQLEAVEDAAIRDAVRLQEAAGLKSATDGEFRREQWHADFLYSIPGIRKGAFGPPIPVYRKDEQISWAPNATEVLDRLHRDLRGPLRVPEGDGHHGAAEAHRPLPQHGPQCLPTRSSPRRHSDSRERADVHPASQRAATVSGPRSGARGTSAERRREDIVLRRTGRERESRVHMCRGNYQSAWFSSGGYDYVAEAVFGGLKVDGLFLEYDDERSGSFEPLRFVPEDQTVVLGLVTTKTPELESKDDLKRRVDEAAKYVDLDRLCLSGQCGFASTVEGNSLTIDEERAKLELIADVAEEIWGR